MRRLAENYEIDGMKVFEPSLNDIFVEYASEEGEEK
jgi:ABC-2 type transport system ATP-binding protein